MRNVLSAREIRPKEHNMIWRKTKVDGIGAVLVSAAVVGFELHFHSKAKASLTATYGR